MNGAELSVFVSLYLSVQKLDTFSVLFILNLLVSNAFILVEVSN